MKNQTKYETFKDSTQTLEITEIDFASAKRGDSEACPVVYALIRKGNANVHVGKRTCIYSDGKKTVDFVLPKDLRDSLHKYDLTGKKFTGNFTLLIPQD